MDCRECEELLDASLAGELDHPAQLGLDAHLAECASCRAASQTLQSLDAALVRAFRPLSGRSGAVADRTVAELFPPPRQSSGNRVWRAASLLAAAAAGFAAALVVWQPWRAPPPGIAPAGQVAAVPDEPVARPAVAKVVLATGPVQVRATPAAEWTEISPLQSFACPQDASIQTPRGVLCELETTDGCVVRMNEETRLGISRPDELRLSQGQIWCSAPESKSLRVIAECEPANADSPPAGAALAASGLLQCSSDSAALAALRPNGVVEVTAAAGRIELTAEQCTHQLEDGAAARIAGGRVEIVETAETPSDPLLAGNWMHPLLVRKGHGARDVTERVDALLARVGQAKVTFLYEQSIRSLGEHGALPLLRYIQSSISSDSLGRRRTAMRLLVDLAPAWMAEEMIDLLEDGDPEIREQAAAALQRLTGHAFDFDADVWRSEGAELARAVAQWRDWWGQNGAAYPTPPPDVGRPAGTPHETAPSDSPAVLKVRR